MVRLRPPKSLGFTEVLTGLRPGPYVYHPPRLPPLNIMDLSSNLPKWLTPLNLPTLSGNLHQIAPAQIQDCNLVQIPPSEIAPISTELHQTALNCTDLASKSFLHRRKHPFPMTIGHQGGSSQIKVSPFFEPGRPASMLRCDAWGYAWNDQIRLNPTNSDRGLFVTRIRSEFQSLNSE
jgi:hypothetical protein